MFQEFWSHAISEEVVNCEAVSCHEELTKTKAKMSFDRNWFHGLQTRDRAEEILRENGFAEGLFLVRESSTAGGDFVLSVVHDHEVIHYQIRRRGEDALFSLSEEKKVSLMAVYLLCLSQLSVYKDSSGPVWLKRLRLNKTSANRNELVFEIVYKCWVYFFRLCISNGLKAKCSLANHVTD